MLGGKNMNELLKKVPHTLSQRTLKEPALIQTHPGTQRHGGAGESIMASWVYVVITQSQDISVSAAFILSFCWFGSFLFALFHCFI